MWHATEASLLLFSVELSGKRGLEMGCRSFSLPVMLMHPHHPSEIHTWEAYWPCDLETGSNRTAMRGHKATEVRLSDVHLQALVLRLESTGKPRDLVLQIFNCGIIEAQF